MFGGDLPNLGLLPPLKASPRAPPSVLAWQHGNKSLWSRPTIRAFLMGANDSTSGLRLLAGHTYVLEQIARAVVLRSDQRQVGACAGFSVVYGHQQQ